MYQKILVIQTAFIGDVILATAVLEKLHRFFPKSELHFLVRKGNESLFAEHPFSKKIWVWDKKNGKYKHLWHLRNEFRKENFDLIVNLQRFANSGFLTAFSNARTTIGFDKNPFSWFFTKKIKHEIQNGTHEVDRNLKLISEITDSSFEKPHLYPTLSDYEIVRKYQTQPYICLAPASVWYTKQFPSTKWVEFLQSLPKHYQVYLLGAKSDKALCEEIQNAVSGLKIYILAGELSLLASAALMQNAQMNYANDSSPLHLASAVNAPICAVFCSTTPDFGFTPLSDRSFLVEIQEKLPCRPCGLHGKKKCPEGHFKCAKNIEIKQLLNCVE